MQRNILLSLGMILAVALAIGCNKPAGNAGAGGNAGGTGAASGEGTAGAEHGHVHEGDDQLVWQRADLEHEGCLISLGHHGAQLYADHNAEPAVMITRDGKPVADAKVFVTLLDAKGEKELVSEQATIYEPPTDEEPAHYAQAKLKIPAEATEVTLRYRIELPGAAEFSQSVPVKVEKH